MRTPQTLVVGLGSAHGDDQAGWMIARAVSALFPNDKSITVRLAKNPLDLMDWLKGIDTLHVCDVSDDFDAVGASHRFSWKAGRLCATGICPEEDAIELLVRFRNRSSHDFGLPQVLQLAAVTQNLPEEINIWTVEGRRFSPGDSMCEATLWGVLNSVEAIKETLSRTAFTVSGIRQGSSFQKEA